jgi:hypothetical protein
MRDSSGMMAPVGSSLSLKEFIQLPREMRDITLAANTLVRGNFSRDLWPDLAMLNAIAPRHRLTQIFIASVTAGSMAQNGQATTNFLQGSVGMIAPSALSTYLTSPEARQRNRQMAHKSQDGKSPSNEDNE